MTYESCSRGSDPSNEGTASDSLSFQHPRDAYQRFATKHTVDTRRVNNEKLETSWVPRVDLDGYLTVAPNYVEWSLQPCF